jgi:hypothetical protein
MLTLIEFNLPVLAVALLIGIATGAWMFRRRRPATTDQTETTRP